MSTLPDSRSANHAAADDVDRENSNDRWKPDLAFLGIKIVCKEGVERKTGRVGVKKLFSFSF